MKKIIPQKALKSEIELCIKKQGDHRPYEVFPVTDLESTH